MSNFDQTSAERILLSNSILSEGINAGVVVKNIQRTDKDGLSFMWDDGSVYCIANFKALTDYTASQAEALFAAGDYDGAVAVSNVSARVSVEDADKLSRSLRATIEMEMATTKKGITGLFPKKVVALEPVAPRKFTFGNKATVTVEEPVVA